MLKTILIIIFSSPAWGAASVLSGYLDVRPSWKGSRGSFHTENEIGAAYALGEHSSLGYVQEFRTNLSGSDETFGPKDGYLKGVWDEVADTKLGTIGLEARVILPTDPAERAAGLRGTLRPIAKLGWELTGALGLELWESPVLPWYGQAGAEGRANRAFENRLELIASVKLWSDRVSLRVPLIHQAMRLRDYESAAEWKHVLWINPELLFTVAAQTSLGASYYSDNLVGEGGLAEGVTQLVFQQSF